MKIKAQLSFHYQDPAQALVAHQALNPDNHDFLESRVQDNVFICDVKGDALHSVLATLDDIIFSEIMVEKVLMMKGEEK